MRISNRELASALSEMLNKMSPEEGCAALIGGFFANVLGAIPDDRWEEMMLTMHSPCGMPDCDCEKLRAKVMPALNELREDFKVITADIG